VTRCAERFISSGASEIAWSTASSAVACCFDFEGEVHTLVAAVLLRLAGLDARGLSAQAVRNNCFVLGTYRNINDLQATTGGSDCCASRDGAFA
jgi:hypothetical protein